MFRHRVWLGGFAALALVACGEQDRIETTGSELSSGSKMDTLLNAVVNKGVTVASAHKAFPKSLLRLKTGSVGGKQEVLIDVFIKGDIKAIGKLKGLGASIRTVTSTGIMTATVPVSALNALAALAEVERIEASRPVKLANDLSNTLTLAGGMTAGMNNPRQGVDGSGVIVGVIDTGIDWTHREFINEDGTTRVVAYWDQSDPSDDRPPAGFTIGHEYTRDELNLAVAAARSCNVPPTDKSWVAACTSPIKASARDTDGHGTHVAGTAAGNGSATGKAGAAPKAELVIVKFDFDSAERNSDTNIIDGVNYIFQKAKAESKPAVINMSLGSDFGPHDGTTLEERGIDALTGPGKVVVVAAGNPGKNNWSQKLRWGYALHGQAALGSEEVVFHVPAYTAGADNYVFFDVWYPGGKNKCRVTITTPSGVTYPPSSPLAKTTWVTGSAFTGYNTAQGALLVANGGDQLDWGDNNPDHEAYVEISDYWGTLPASGDWKIKLVPADSKSVCQGTFHAWYGVSDNIVKGWQNETARIPPTFGGRPSDNAMTIGSPATAGSVIAVAAYMTRSSWTYVYGVALDLQGNPICTADHGRTQDYADPPIAYYDEFAVGELAYFSGRGPRREANPMVKPEIAAPGVGIASALSHFVLNAEWGQNCTQWPGGPYHFGTNRVMDLETTVMQGTSMATPNATGAIATLLQAKKDLQDTCLRKLFSTSARHDAITDDHDTTPFTARTDTDTAAGPDKPNFDWGYGKLDIADTLAAIAALPICSAPCATDANCATGFTCSKADPCCWTCVAKPSCFATGTACTVNSDCCSSSCTGKPGKKVCK